MGHFRKALTACAVAFGGTFATQLWAAADGGVTGGEFSGAVGAAVAVAVAAGLGVLGVTNDDTINLRRLTPTARRDVVSTLEAHGQKPA
jgi:hypothetical protein